MDLIEIDTLDGFAPPARLDGRLGLRLKAGPSGTPSLDAILARLRNTVDTRGHTVRIELDAGSGDFFGPVDATGPLTGGGRLDITGVNGTARLLSNERFVLRSANQADIRLSAVDLGSTGEALTTCVIAAAGGRIELGADVSFLSCTNAHIEAVRGGEIVAAADYRVVGSATSHLHAVRGGIISIEGRRVTIEPGVDFAQYVLGCSFGFIGLGGTQFVGQGSGMNYIVHLNGVVRVDPGTDLNRFLPGDRPGVMKDGGAILGQPYQLVALSQEARDALGPQRIGTIILNTSRMAVEIWIGRGWRAMTPE